jgi:rod shape-determining protein MreD
MVVRNTLLVVLLSAAVIVDVTWLARLPLGGAPDVLLLTVLSVGLRHGLVAGALVGAVAGYLRDLVGGGPMGLYALAYLLTGSAAGAASPLVDVQQRGVPAAAAVVGTALLTALIAGAVLATGIAPVPWVPVARGAAAAGVLNALLAHPIDRVVAWFDRLAARRYEDRMIGHRGRR